MVPRPLRSEDADHFDLLPFIAILMCTLGCLLFTTLSVAALSLGTGAAEGWIPVVDPKRPHKTPVLIEWDERLTTIHRDRRVIVARWSQAGWEALTGDTPAGSGGAAHPPPEVRSLLDDLARHRETDYALFAVRPAG